MDIRCMHCDTVKPETEYYPSLRVKTRWCKSCCGEYRRASYKADPKKYLATADRYHKKNKAKLAEARRWRHRLNKYGVTKDQYIVMLASQEHRCAICDAPFVSTVRSKRICVDHNHETGKVRGLLCETCNRGIGLLQDNPAVLTRAAQYVS